MPRFALMALTALSLTLATQAGAAAYIRFGGVEGESLATVNRDVVVDIVTAPARRSIIIVDVATGDGDRGPDAGSDAGAGRDATGG